MKYELIPGDSWLWWPVLVTSRRKHVKLVYTGCKSCDDFGELMLRSMLQVDAEIITDRSWTIRDDRSAEAEQQSTRVHARCSAWSYTPRSTRSAGGLLRQRTSNALDMFDSNRCELAFGYTYIDSEVKWECGSQTASCNLVRAS